MVLVMMVAMVFMMVMMVLMMFVMTVTNECQSLKHFLQSGTQLLHTDIFIHCANFTAVIQRPPVAEV
jgi:hypothetical protein